MSLYYLNKDRDISDDYRAGIAKGQAIGRVLAAAELKVGQEALLPLYTAFGERIHQQKQERAAGNVDKTYHARGDFSPLRLRHNMAPRLADAR